VLDFAHPDLRSTSYAVPPFTPSACVTAAETTGPEYQEWPALKKYIVDQGWKLPR
jgi:hypothetical protein